MSADRDYEGVGFWIGVALVYLGLAWYWTFWPFAAEWRGYVYPTAAYFRELNADEEDSRMYILAAPTEDECYAALEDWDRTVVLGKDDFMVGCARLRIADL